MFKQSFFIIFIAGSQCLLAQNRNSSGGQNNSSNCYSGENNGGHSYSNQSSNGSYHNYSERYSHEEVRNQSDRNNKPAEVGQKNWQNVSGSYQQVPVCVSAYYGYSYYNYQSLCQPQEVTATIKLTADTELPTRWGSKIKFKGGTTVKLNGNMAVEGILAANIEVPSGKLRLHFRAGTKIAVNNCGYISQGTLDEDTGIPNRKGRMIVHKAGSTVYVDSNGIYHGLIYFQKPMS